MKNGQNQKKKIMINNTLQTFDVNILTLFPEVFPGTLGVSLLGKALEKKITKVYLDRGSYKFHGRIKIFAETLKKNGLII